MNPNPEARVGAKRFRKARYLKGPDDPVEFQVDPSSVEADSSSAVPESLRRLLTDDTLKQLDSLGSDSLDRVMRKFQDLVRAAEEEDPLSTWWERFTEEQRGYLLDPALNKIVAGGNQSGKTRSEAFEAACMLQGWYPRDWPESRKVKRGRSVVIIGCMDRKTQARPEGIQETLLSMLRPGAIRRIIYAEAHAISEVHLWNGSVAVFIVYKGGTQALESYRANLLWLDEEPPDRKIWVEGKQRLIITGGVTAISLTPDEGLTWIYWDLIKTGQVSAHYLDTYKNPAVDEATLREADTLLTAQEIVIRRKGRFIPLVGSPRFDVSRLTVLYEKSYDPQLWIETFWRDNGGRRLSDREAEGWDRENLQVGFQHVPRGTPGAVGLYCGPDEFYDREGSGRKWENRFAMGLDWSEGVRGGNEQAIVVQDRYLKTEVAVCHGIWDVTMLGPMAHRLALLLGNAHICPEIGGSGLWITKYLVANYGFVYLRPRPTDTHGDYTDQFGHRMNFNGKQHVEGLAQRFISEVGTEYGGMIRYTALFEQLFTYERGEHGTGSAPRRLLDDLVDAWMMAELMSSEMEPVISPRQKELNKEREHYRSLRSRPKKAASWMGA